MTDEKYCDECILGPCDERLIAECELRSKWRELKLVTAQEVARRRARLDPSDAGEGQSRPGFSSREAPPGGRSPEGTSGGGKPLPHPEHGVTRLIVGDCLPGEHELAMMRFGGAPRVAREVAAWLGEEHARLFAECRAQLFNALGGSQYFELDQEDRVRAAQAYVDAFVARDGNAPNRPSTSKFVYYWVSDFVRFDTQKKGEEQSCDEK